MALAMHGDESGNGLRSRISFSAMVVGAVIALTLAAASALVGLGIALWAYPLEARETPGPLAWALLFTYFLVSAVIGFYSAGYVAARLAETRKPWDAAFHGLGAFSLFCAFVLSFFGGYLINALSSMAMVAGMGGEGFSQMMIYLCLGIVALMGASAGAAAVGAKRGLRSAVQADRRWRHQAPVTAAEKNQAA